LLVSALQGREEKEGGERGGGKKGGKVEKGREGERKGAKGRERERESKGGLVSQARHSRYAMGEKEVWSL